MKARALAACVLVCAMAAVNGAWGQAPQVRPGQTTTSPAATESKSATAVLRGTVTAAETGAPLARARVRITEVTSAGRASARTVIADTSGRWEAGKLPAGRYRVSASKPPYVALEFGQRQPQEPGKEIVLADGQLIEKLNLRLPRGAVIAGQVTDDLVVPPGRRPLKLCASNSSMDDDSW